MADKGKKKDEAEADAIIPEVEYELDAEGNQVLDADGNPIPKKKKKSKKKLIIIIAAVVILLGGGAAAFLLMGAEEGENADKPKQDADAAKPDPVYMDLPDIVVNLNSTSRRTNYINLKLTLELSTQEDVAAIEAQMPRIIDAFNTYLTELRREDLQGSAGIYRLENELMLRLQKTLTKGKVNDILFREIIIQ